MADYITLVGAEDVRSAANTMRSAADDMRCAASTISIALEHQQRFMNDWLERFRQAMTAPGEDSAS